LHDSCPAGDLVWIFCALPLCLVVGAQRPLSPVAVGRVVLGLRGNEAGGETAEE